MRQEIELTQEELNEILEAGKPTPVMYLSGGVPLGETAQEKANRAWKRLADKRGFVWDSVEPVSGKAMNFITAEMK